MLCELRLLVPFLVLTNFCLLSDFLLEVFFVDRFPTEPLLSTVIYIIKNQFRKRSTESWTAVFGFKVPGANHFTIESTQIVRMRTLCGLPLLVGFPSLFVMITVCLLFGIFRLFFHWSVSFLTRCVNSNLQQWSKVIEKKGSCKVWTRVFEFRVQVASV